MNNLRLHGQDSAAKQKKADMKEEAALRARMEAANAAANASSSSAASAAAPAAAASAATNDGGLLARAPSAAPLTMSFGGFKAKPGGGGIAQKKPGQKFNFQGNA